MRSVNNLNLEGDVKLKSKLLLVLSLVIVAPICDAANTRKDIVVKEVGLSKNSNRVFVKSSTLAIDSECSDKAHYAIELGSPESYVFYSAALSALNEGKKMRVLYELDECLGDAPRVDVFWNLGY